MDFPKNVPLKCKNISELGLLGMIGSFRVRQIIYDKKNGFSLIRVGGTETKPHYGVTSNDCERYMKEKAEGKI